MGSWGGFFFLVYGRPPPEIFSQRAPAWQHRAARPMPPLVEQHPAGELGGLISTQGTPSAECRRGDSLNLIV